MFECYKKYARINNDVCKLKIRLIFATFLLYIIMTLASICLFIEVFIFVKNIVGQILCGIISFIGIINFSMECYNSVNFINSLLDNPENERLIQDDFVKINNV